MKGSFAVLSLILVMTFAAAAQTASQSKPEQLTKKQLNALIASAKTEAEHNRIAAYFQGKAADLEAQAGEHESMIAAYEANTTLSNDKNRASTIDHCQYYVKTFKALADKNRELAIMHERMASEAPEQLSANGK
jgi:hypothetical protein